MLPIKTILHPTDFSDRAEYGFQLACALARDYGARLILCHVHQIPPVVYGEFGAAPPEPIGAAEEMGARLLAIRPADENIPVEHRMMEGNPAEEIVRMAKETECDLIVLGTHGRTGLGRLLMGSVAEQVVRKAPCPVLTVKSPAPMMAHAGQAEASATH
jgi:nucleotide-binding universal stress UspA family protein